MLVDSLDFILKTWSFCLEIKVTWVSRHEYQESRNKELFNMQSWKGLDKEMIYSSNKEEYWFAHGALLACVYKHKCYENLTVVRVAI